LATINLQDAAAVTQAVHRARAHQYHHVANASPVVTHPK
jgi:hypothetical protein